jgi:hypothetical protein
MMTTCVSGENQAISPIEARLSHSRVESLKGQVNQILEIHVAFALDRSFLIYPWSVQSFHSHLTISRDVSGLFASDRPAGIAILNPRCDDSPCVFPWMDGSDQNTSRAMTLVESCSVPRQQMEAFQRFRIWKHFKGVSYSRLSLELRQRGDNASVPPKTVKISGKSWRAQEERVQVRSLTEMKDA